MKALWKNPEFAKHQLDLQGRKPNNAELYLDSVLQLNFPNNWRYVGDGKLWVSGKNPDFIFTNKDQKLIIESDNSYWHKNKQKDEERDPIYRKYGYKILILTENDLKEESLLIEKIRKFQTVTIR